MMAYALRWILHWFGQGLKLLLFAFLAAVFTIPFSLAAGLVEFLAGLPDAAWAGRVITVTGIGILFVLATAVFAAIFASQLRDHPLRPFAGGGPSVDDPETASG